MIYIFIHIFFKNTITKQTKKVFVKDDKWQVVTRYNNRLEMFQQGKT